MSTRPIWSYTAELQQHVVNFHGRLRDALRRSGFKSFRVLPVNDLGGARVIGRRVRTTFDSASQPPLLLALVNELAAFIRSELPSSSCITTRFEFSNDCQVVHEADGFIVRASLFHEFNSCYLEFDVLCLLAGQEQDGVGGGGGEDGFLAPTPIL